MGIIKKAKPADAIDETEDEGSAPEDEAASATAADAVAGEGLDETPEEDAADAATMEALAAADAPAEAASSDDLLNMFTSVGIETVDRTVLLQLAPDVDMADLVSELNLVAAALGVVMADRQQAPEQEYEALAA